MRFNAVPGHQNAGSPLMMTGSHASQRKHDSGTRGDYMSGLSSIGNTQELAAAMRSDEDSSTAQGIEKKVDDLMRNIKDVPFE